VRDTPGKISSRAITDARATRKLTGVALHAAMRWSDVSGHAGMRRLGLTQVSPGLPWLEQGRFPNKNQDQEEQTKGQGTP
jgi:hypothetical protein